MRVRRTVATPGLRRPDGPGGRGVLRTRLVSLLLVTALGAGGLGTAATRVAQGPADDGGSRGAAAGAPAAVEVRIEGVDDALAAAARANLELLEFGDRALSAAQLRRLVTRGEQQIRRGLEPLGHYESRVVGSIAGQAPRWEVSFRVAPGERVRVRRADVVVAGPAGELESVRRAVQEFALRAGEPLEHALYEAGKSRIGAALQAAGFFDAELRRHRVEVTRAERSADIDLAWQGGERYRFGAVEFSEAQFPPDYLRRYVPWQADAWYSVEDLLVLQQRLVDADYFSTVSVLPLPARRAAGRVPVEVLLVPARRTLYSAAAYLSTDVGPGGRVGLDRRWINDRGHKWGAQLEYSPRLQSASTRYRVPRPGVRSRLYDFAGGYRDETTGTTRSRLTRLSAAEVLDRWRGYTRTLGLQYLDGDFEIADERRASRLLFAEALLERKRSDDPLFPRRGIAVDYALRLAAPGLLADTSLAQLRADARWVRPAGRDSRLILRASAGALAAGDFDALPPALRFFAGGDRSVRGFDYDAIGERNATGGVIGGRNLLVASAEYEHWFLERWGAAAFVDAGDAFSSSFNANVGAGLGVRWRSPVGLVRIDLGVPVVTDLDTDELRVHVIIGPDL